MGVLVFCPGWLGPTDPVGDVMPGAIVVVATGIVEPGVKPWIVEVVVRGTVVVVVVVVVVVGIESTGTPGIVVVVVVGGVFTTLTDNEYAGSVSNITTARLL